MHPAADQPAPAAGPREAAAPARGNAYKDVRSLSRGLAIIEALGQLGWAKLGKLSAFTGIDRTTTYRLVSTLIEEGYVVRREEDGAVALSSKLVTISQNLNDNDLVSQVVIRHLSALTRAIKWPSDFAVLSRGALRIAASTHSESPMSLHRAMVGNTRPLFRSALGKAYLAALPPGELDEVLMLVRGWDGADGVDAQAPAAIARSLAEVRQRGYAAAEGTTEAKFSAIALPLVHRTAVLGAVNVIFMRSALTPGEAAQRYLPRLSEAVGRIAADLDGVSPDMAGPEAT
ncbi:MAG: helix-turn-helix domain-containing protein [Rhizobiaceae bacterium]|nr:helix-turn-helix domain-containing protein [Rhizobiaceae bacterium]